MGNQVTVLTVYGDKMQVTLPRAAWRGKPADMCWKQLTGIYRTHEGVVVEWCKRSKATGKFKTTYVLATRGELLYWANGCFTDDRASLILVRAYLVVRAAEKRRDQQEKQNRGANKQ